MVNRRFLGIGIILTIAFIVIVFGDAIFPTLTSTPVRFDVTEGISQADMGFTGRSCAIYPDDQGC